MIDKALPQPEFSRPFDTPELGEKAEQRVIEANADECRALAERFGVLGIAALKAELTIRRLGPALVRLEGRLTAEVSQQCVITLDPVESAIDERFAVTYAGSLPHEEGATLPFHDDNEEGPDPLDGTAIDLGETVSQQLAVSLDPYPRAPGASLEKILPRRAAAPDEPAGPFAVLAALRKRMS
jgi:uncharacterized metal-binding protein YceD (DUF177 family)